MQGTRWVFTYNNYSQDDIARLESLGGNMEGAGISYLIFGREVAESGTPHLQGYCIFNARRRLRSLRELIGERGHFEISRGTPQQASDYCKKEGNYSEFGSLPRRRAAPSVSDFCDWVRSLDHFPTEREIANNYPGLWIRYNTRLVELAVQIRPRVVLEDGELLPWQQELFDRLIQQPDDRTVTFVIDEAGGMGKTWFCRYCYSRLENVQLLSVDKKENLALAIDVTKSVFLFNVARGGMEYIQYQFLENLKDRLVFSGKYYSQMKILLNKCHVIVLCNEQPDMTKMTHDRYNIINI